MLQKYDTTIDGYSLRVTQLALGVSRPMAFKLLKVAGPAIASFVGELDGKKLADVKPSAMAGAIRELTERLDYATFDLFVKTFAGVTEVLGADGSNTLLSGSIDLDAFDGNYATLCKWLAFCVEKNFASFLSGSGLTALRA